MSISWPLVFDDVFKISTKSLRWNGSYPGAMIRGNMWMAKKIGARFIAVLCFYLLVNSIIFHDVMSKEYTEAIKNGIMAIVAVTVTFKHVILIGRRKYINDLIDTINEDYKEASHFADDEKDIIIKYTQKGVKVCQFWLVSASLTSLMFPVKAFVLMAHSYFKGNFELVPMFDFTYPKLIDLYKNEPLVYFLTFLVCLSFDIYSMTVYIGFDPLVPIFVLHTCGQLELMSKRLMDALHNANDVNAITEKLKSINMKLADNFRFVQCIQDIFVILYEFNMKTTTFLLPFTAFQIVEKLRHGEISLEFAFFFSGAFLHFYIPCYYSNLLMEKSESLRDAIYSCGWEKQPNIQVRKTILLMLTRTSKSLVIRTVFFPICLDTFAEMARQAYGIYNIMNAAWG